MAPRLDIAAEGRGLARQLARRLESVTDSEQRRFLLKEFFSENEPDEVLHALHALVLLALGGKHRDAWIAVSIALCSGKMPAHLLGELYRSAAHIGLHAMRLMLMGGDVAYRVAKEMDFSPDDIYEQLSLGERKARARSYDINVLDRLLYDPNSSVIRILLGNPHMTEEKVIKMVARRPNRTEVLREVGRHSKWLSRARIRKAVVQSPYTPIRISLTLMPLQSPTQLQQMASDKSLHQLVRQAAKVFLTMRGWQEPTFH
jgi:hypothetical protein